MEILLSHSLVTHITKVCAQDLKFNFPPSCWHVDCVCAVCMLCLCLCGFSPGALLSSYSPKTCNKPLLKFSFCRCAMFIQKQFSSFVVSEATLTYWWGAWCESQALCADFIKMSSLRKAMKVFEWWSTKLESHFTVLEIFLQMENYILSHLIWYIRYIISICKSDLHYTNRKFVLYG